MANAIWATWYNLEDRNRASFQSWLHESYLPAIAASPRFGWVAHYESKAAPPQSERKADGSLVIGHTKEEIGDGQEYVLIIGAADPKPFLDPLFLSAAEQGVKGAKEQLTLRQGTRQVLYLEQQEVFGKAPNAKNHPPYPGPVIQFGSFRIHTVQDEFESASFYELKRLPYMASSPGCIRTRTFAGIAGWAKHGVIYEFTDIAARNETWDYARRLKASGNGEQAQGIGDRTMHTPGSPVVGERTFAAMCKGK